MIIVHVQLYNSNEGIDNLLKVIDTIILCYIPRIPWTLKKMQKKSNNNNQRLTELGQ